MLRISVLLLSLSSKYTCETTLLVNCDHRLFERMELAQAALEAGAGKTKGSPKGMRNKEANIIITSPNQLAADGTPQGLKGSESLDGPKKIAVPPGHFTSEDLLIDDTLPPLERVLKYTSAKMALQRLVHVRMIGDTAVAVGAADTLKFLFPLLRNLVVDPEFVVRKELAAQLQILARVCAENGSQAGDGGRTDGYNAVLHDLLPIVSQLLGDSASAEVRKAASDALVDIGYFLKQEDFMHILTIVIEFAGSDTSEENRMVAAELLNMLAPLLGKEEMCRQFLVPTVVSLAEDGAFRVRMSVARHIANVFRTSLEEDIVERLLPAFFNLAEDEIWGVRKACAESLWQIARALPNNLKHKYGWQKSTLVGGKPRNKKQKTLNKIYCDYVNVDPSKWVRNTAYQYLGHFLTAMSGVLGNNDDPWDSNEAFSKIVVEQTSSAGPGKQREAYSASIDFTNMGIGKEHSSFLSAEDTADLSAEESTTKKDITTDPTLLAAYQSMAYPDSSEYMSQSSLDQPAVRSSSGTPLSQHPTSHMSHGPRGDLSESLNSADSRVQKSPLHGSASAQDPRPDPDDLAMFCAYSLPGVALSLGKDQWGRSLRRVFLTLIENPQPRVRRTLAYSLHILAQILGPNMSEEELLNAFDTLLHDVDEVRIGVVENLAVFLRALDNPCRESFLVVMSEILEGVGRRNWRFRLLLANQLGFFGILFSPPATVSVVQSLVFKMLHDQVATVRKAGAKWVGTIANRLEGKFDWQDAFVSRLVDELGNGKSYHQRLLYIEICVVLKKHIKLNNFERLCRPTLDRLKVDPVANVKSFYDKKLTNGEI